MPAYSLYAQMRGLPPPEPEPPVIPTPEEEAEYEAIAAELYADCMASHYRTAQEARSGIARQMIPVAFGEAKKSRQICKAVDVEELAGEMLLALAEWLNRHIPDDDPFGWWGWQHKGGFSIKQHGGTMLRKALDAMRKARNAYFKILPEPIDVLDERVRRWWQKTSTIRGKQVRLTLALLDPLDRHLLEMWMEGLTIREMAKKIQEPKSTVDRWLGQAMEKFREKFVEKWDKPQKTGSYYSGGVESHDSPRPVRPRRSPLGISASEIAAMYADPANTDVIVRWTGEGSWINPLKPDKIRVWVGNGPLYATILNSIFRAKSQRAFSKSEG